MMSTRDGVIDLFVCSLPASMMHRKTELEKILLGKHSINDDKTITVKEVWITSQPVAGLLAYFKERGIDQVKKLKPESILVIDFGYLTVDFGIINKFIEANNRTGACELGMSNILKTIAVEAAPILELDSLTVDLIDQAFYSENSTLTVFGHHFPFPSCKNHEFRNKTYDFDFNDRIQVKTSEAATYIYNVVGNESDISRIVLLGGPAKTYKKAIEERYPNNVEHLLPWNIKLG